MTTIRSAGPYVLTYLPTTEDCPQVTIFHNGNRVAEYYGHEAYDLAFDHASLPFLWEHYDADFRAIKM